MDEDKRRQILYGVWQVIAKSGLQAVSVRSVAAAAGVSPGRVQHYFTTKQELVRASAQEMIAAAVETVDGATVADGAVRGEEQRLGLLLWHAFGRAETSKIGTAVYFAYVAAAAADPTIADLLADAKATLIDEVARLLPSSVSTAERTAVAQRLVLLADGATQAVLLGALDATQAREVIEAAARREGVTLPS